jgi:hypothetical protein
MSPHHLPARTRRAKHSGMKMPNFARALGLSGLLPLLALVVLLATNGDAAIRSNMLALGLIYAALILSFLGGLWWGLGAANNQAIPGWVWVAAVVPSLYAWVPVGMVSLKLLAAPTALMVIGAGLWLALFVDRAMVVRGLAPGWWMALRSPLSLGLGALSMVAALLF